MIYIGNILTNSNIKIGNEFKVVKTLDEVDSRLPTLIIGWQFAKQIIPSFNILNKKYIVNDISIYWTFKKSERKAEYDNDIEDFKHTCYQNLLNSVNYKYIDISYFKYNNIKRFLLFIHNNKNIRYFYLTSNQQFLFIYNPSNNKKNTVYGISLSLCNYLGVKVEKLINNIKSNKLNKLIYTPTFINDSFKQFLYKNLYLIPFLESF